VKNKKLKKLNIKSSLDQEKLIYSNKSANNIELQDIVFGILQLLTLIGLSFFVLFTEVILPQKILILIGLLIWLVVLENVLYNKRKGNNLLGIRRDLLKDINLSQVKEILIKMGYEITILEEQQVRGRKGNEYYFLDYELTLLKQGEQYFFNNRSVRKGKSHKSIFGGRVNEKVKNIFEEELSKIKDG